MDGNLMIVYYRILENTVTKSRMAMNSSTYKCACASSDAPSPHYWWNGVPAVNYPAFCAVSCSFCRLSVYSLESAQLFGDRWIAIFHSQLLSAAASWLSVTFSYCHLLPATVSYYQLVSANPSYCQLFDATINCRQLYSYTLCYLVTIINIYVLTAIDRLPTVFDFHWHMMTAVENLK